MNQLYDFASLLHQMFYPHRTGVMGLFHKQRLYQAVATMLYIYFTSNFNIGHILVHPIKDFYIKEKRLSNSLVIKKA